MAFNKSHKHLPLAEQEGGGFFAILAGLLLYKHYFADLLGKSGTLQC